MVSQIQLGSIFQENGRTVIGGSQSGFDTKSIIDALATAKSQPATDLTAKNKTIDSQQAALTTLKTDLSQFQSALDSLRNPPGVQNTSQNIFSYRTASISSNDGSTAANYLGVTAQPGASIQDFTINEIHQLAQATKQRTGDFVLADTTGSVVTAGASAGFFTAGTFTLKGLNGASDASVTLNTGDSLQTVVNKFNATTTATGIQANILNISTAAGLTTYEIVFTAAQTGTANGFDLRPAGTTITSGGAALANVTFNPTQDALDAKFTIDQVPITRSTNSITDVISGLTFNLKQVTPTLPAPTTLNVSIQPDTTIVANAISHMVDMYNQFRLFNSTQTQLGTDGTPLDTAVLANDSTLRTINQTIVNEMTNIVSGITGTNPSQLSDIGLSFSEFAGDDTNPATSNVLSINTDTLNSALLSNFQNVANVFQFNMTSDNANFAIYSRANTLSTSQFQLTIDRTIPASPVYQATYTDPVAGLTTIDLTGVDNATTGGVTLTAPAGSALEGLTMFYLVSGNATINVNITQGIADRAYNAVTGYLDKDTGILVDEQNALTTQKQKNTDQITAINDQVATYRDQLTAQYATLEAALTQANSLLSLLTAQSNAQLSNSGH